MIQTHPNDVTSSGSHELVRSPWLDTESGNPLVNLAPRERAIVVLLQAGEDPTLVGRLLLRVPKSKAAAAARAVLAEAATETGITPTKPSTTAVSRLHHLVPARVPRWVFVLRASNLFEMTQVATLVRAHRATTYRMTARVTASLRAATATA